MRAAQRAADIGNAYCDTYVDVRRRSTIDDFAATAQATQQKIDEIDQALARIDATAATTTPPETEPPTTTRNSPSTVSPAATTTVISATDKAQRDTLSAQKQSLQKSLDQILISQQNAQSGGPQLLSPAKPPSGPTSPNPKYRDVLTGLLVGMLLGVAGAFLLDFLDDSIKSRTDLEAATKQAPILAIIPYLADWKNRAEAHLASIEQPSSPTAEAYRTLRTSVRISPASSDPSTACRSRAPSPRTARPPPARTWRWRSPAPASAWC